jgi:two-component system NtrC family sensor kinase
MSVQDNGSGIPETHLSRIFDPFFTTKDEKKGTGLGLSICHRIVEQHGGLIEVQSTVGRGTTFSIVLPAAGVSSGPVRRAEDH